jgi:hypothetical protein
MERDRGAQRVHALGHDAQRVDVEARVGLVEDGQLRLEQRHLEDLVALLLAAEKPSFTERASRSWRSRPAWPSHAPAHEVVRVELGSRRGACARR